MTESRSLNSMKARRTHEIRAMMSKVFENHKRARDDLEKRLKEGQLVNAFALRPALAAQADMLPWGRVTQLNKTGTDIYEAMLEVRKMAQDTLTGYGEAVSSDMLALEIDRMEREGMRRFIKATARFITPIDAPRVVPRHLSGILGNLRLVANELEQHGLTRRAIVTRTLIDQLSDDLRERIATGDRSKTDAAERDTGGDGGTPKAAN